MIGLLSLLAITLASPPVAPAPAPEEPVGQPGLRMVATQSAVVGGNAAGARERALEEALRQAVSQALAEMVDAQTRAAQAKGVEALEARARSFVRGYRTLEEGEANGSYGVRLEVEVDEPALRRAADRLAATGTGVPPGTPPRGPGAGVLLVASGPPEAGPALAAAVSAAGGRAQLAEGALDQAAAVRAAARASLSAVAFLTAEASGEGPVRGTGKVGVSCRMSARVIATASGLPVAEPAAAPRSFADAEEPARSDCLARAAAELAPRLLPASGPTSGGGDLRTIAIEADVVEPGAVGALLKTVRSVGRSSAELRRVSPGRAEIRVRTRALATALAPALSRDAGGVITLSAVEVTGDLIRVRVRLRPAVAPTPNPPPTP